MSTTQTNIEIQKATAERTAEIRECLEDIRARVVSAAQALAVNGESRKIIVAVSKYKPSADILVCYEYGQRDFGENYVQELVDKAKELPFEIQWHFIGTLQSNKAKLLASVPNLHTVQTISSEKIANALNKALPTNRTSQLNVLLQINTSGEDSKSGLSPLTPSSINSSQLSDVQKLAKHIVTSCPNLRLQGLMTIGALDLSLSANETERNADFERLKETRDILERWLQDGIGCSHAVSEGGYVSRGWGWGDECTGKLLVSMGMSSDFEAALKAGSDIVRVGTGIFGSRKTKLWSSS
ncbi:proline synthetase associated protein [Lentinula boryana]|uniref:Pyridoxal phosphate homeostasis protein n=1 Tax=Lentinula boryana TaxID=40481 RepID=A0ABQ8PYZ0_9AGAR|nr:proline synthetase associated protein [Lentinula boryana]